MEVLSVVLVPVTKYLVSCTTGTNSLVFAVIAPLVGTTFNVALGPESLGTVP